jgi:hypothetical protein
MRAPIDFPYTLRKMFDLKTTCSCKDYRATWITPIRYVSGWLPACGEINRNGGTSNECNGTGQMAFPV